MSRRKSSLQREDLCVALQLICPHEKQEDRLQTLVREIVRVHTGPTRIKKGHILPSQIGTGRALSGSFRQHLLESLASVIGVSCGTAMGVTERLFINIMKEMEWLATNFSRHVAAPPYWLLSLWSNESDTRF